MATLPDGGMMMPGPKTVNVAEKEPNNGPDVNGAQNLGSFTDSTTIVITGELSSGGNDGTKYTGDYDIFALELPEAGKVDVKIDWTSDADVDFALYDPQNKPIASEGAMAKPATGSAAYAQGKLVLGLFSKDRAAPYTTTITYTKGAAMGGMCSTTAVMPAEPASGCNITLTTPACSVLDLTGGKMPELTWSTNMTFCEGPHKIQIGGDPPSTWAQGNSVQIEITSTHMGSRGRMTRNIGGLIWLTPEDLASLSSPNGIYYYRVLSYHNSASEIRAFRVVK
jgi:hypothetical protein